MYSLDVNFLNDRAERPTEAVSPTGGAVDSPRPLYYGLAVGLLFPLLALGLWLFLQQRNASLEAQQRSLDEQLATLQAAQKEVEGVAAKVSQINQENQALVTVFDQIKPWSAVFQDIRSRVPAGVQISTIVQSPPEQAAQPAAAGAAPAPAASPAASPAAESPPPADAAVVPPPAVTPVYRIEITGNARSFNDVNDMVLVLQQSPFLIGKETRLVTAELGANPAQIQFVGQASPNRQVQVQLPEVVKYRITSALTNQPASELLQDLRDTLAVGLPARIDALRDLGVVKP